MKTNKTIYWISTIIMSVVYIFGVSMFIFNTEGMKDAFNTIGFPAWLMIPLGIFELLGVGTVLVNKSVILKNMAYGGLLLASSHGLVAHLVAADGGHIPAVVAVLFTAISWIYYRKIF